MIALDVSALLSFALVIRYAREGMALCCVPCLSLGGYLLLLVAVVPPDGEDFDDGDYFVLVDEVDQAVLVADVP